MLKQILIDADTGIDDSIAILFALKRPDVRVMGVTTGFGNTTARQAAENSLRLIRLAGVPYEVPVAVGATEPLAGNWKGPDPHIHGPNGIGGVELPPSPQQPLEEPAWAFIARMAREHPGELTLVTLARMTNLAKALEIEPDLPRLLKRVVFMGGTFHAPGNVSPVAEANIAGDPEAADRVFQAGFDLTMVGLDVTQKVRLTTDHVAILDKYAAPENRPIVVTVRTIPARVECGGSFCRGMVVADLREHPIEAPGVSICVDVDSRRALEELLTTFMA